MDQFKTNKTKKMVLLAYLTAAAIVLSIIESQINIVVVPGAKLGLANLIGLILLYLFTVKEAYSVTLLRIVFVSLVLGSLLSPTFFMGLLGGIFAITAMWLSKKGRLGIVLVSLIGSLAHQVGQIIAGIYIIGTSDIIYYLYIMLPLGVATGVINGLIAEKLILNLRNKADNKE